MLKYNGDFEKLKDYGFELDINDIGQPAWVIDNQKLDYRICIEMDRKIWVESIEYCGILETYEKALEWAKELENLIKDGLVDKEI